MEPHNFQALDLVTFKQMDYYTVEKYHLPIELMMENAGLHLANLVASRLINKEQNIFIGVGNGNNGGGGMVAARRLKAWGYQVYIKPFAAIAKELPLRQWDRALKFGVVQGIPDHIDIWVDAYLGFSQRLPLRNDLINIVKEANENQALKVSLDIPTGFDGDPDIIYFKADIVLTLAYPKTILKKLPLQVDIYVDDLGIPKSVYEKFGVTIPEFQNQNILKLESEAE